MDQYEHLEDRIRAIGSAMYELMEGQVPSLFHGGTWKGRIMEWTMKDPAFKIQLFRFIDVLPALKTDALVVKMLDEYFSGLEAMPRILTRGLAGLSREGFLPHVAGQVIRAGAKSFGRQFIAGEDGADALRALERLSRDGFALSVDLLGEEVLSDTEADRHAATYLELLSVLSHAAQRWPRGSSFETDEKGPIPPLDLSLKVSSFYSHLDPVDWGGSIAATTEQLARVARKASESGTSVTIDMESSYLKDLTLAIFRNLVEQNPGFSFAGVVLQAYLRETRQDLLDMIRWARSVNRRVMIRLVKGAYWDYETVVCRQRGWPVPVFLNKDETDAQYEELTRILLENTDYVRPAIATHNVRSISHALAVADALSLPQEAVEFQFLYGMAEPIRKALREKGYRVRIYSPVGRLLPGMAYLIRRLLENTSNESFLMKSFFERASFEQLIRKPVPGKTVPDEVRDPSVFVNEPPMDFSREENRSRMNAALHRVRQTFGSCYPLFIGGKEVWTDSSIVSTNPAAPSEVLGRVCSGSVDHAEQALGFARTSWRNWRKTPLQDRAAYLFHAAEQLRKKRFELMALEVYEVGKTWKEADGDVAEAIDYFEYYGREAQRATGQRVLGSLAGEKNLYRHEPRGVGVVISPWNFPLAIAAGMVSAALVTGNCVVFKPSGLAPVTGWKLVETFRDAGLPPGVLQFLPGPGHELGEFLVAHPGVDFIAFTGSKDVGLRIVKLAGETLPDQRNVKRVIAEMGGKNAIIVDETADLDEAVKGVLESALGFQGQKCSACSRVIVVGDVFDDFSRRLKDAMASVKIGPTEHPGNTMGPVVDEVAVKRIRQYVELGQTEGRILLRGEVGGTGHFVGPVIIADAAAGAKVAQEEIFGPVVTLLRASDIEHALEIANGTPYALTGGIFSRSPANIEKAQQEFMVGNLYINRKITGALVGRQPFGGFGMSGVGSKAGGSDYLVQFTVMRSISENTLRRGFAPEVPTHLR